MKNNDENIKTFDDDEFITKYGKLVPYTIKKTFSPGALPMVFGNTSLDYDDLVQIGFIGLCKARDRFEPSYGYAFNTYAIPLIRGELQRALRDNCKIKISRSTHDLKQKIIKADMLHDPIPIIATRFNVSEDDIKKALEYSPNYLYFGSISSNNSNDREATHDENIFDDFDLEEEVSNQELLENFYLEGGLTNTEKSVWHLYNHEELSQTRIADYMGISQSQVSRVIQKVYEKAENFGKRIGLQST
ncbi:sigma-70 family RNA polymerase sigma factor [Bacillus tequilensis]|nr:sigma-70 family RNA polymerase sigma factor [Bacillus tequilensis]